MNLFDIQGRRVKTISVNEETSDIAISPAELGNGIYFLKAKGLVRIDEKVIILE